MDIAQFLPQLGGFAFTLIAFVVALSIIVAIHEYGHYIVGRWCGIHAEVFSLGFGPVLARRTDRRGTVWQVAALPFGGYVKFLGDANAASVGAADVIEEERRRTMLGAPLWARALTVAAGPVFNFALSFVIFAVVILWDGVAADPVRIAAIDPLPPAYEVALEPGDEILAIDGRPVTGLEGLGGVLDAAAPAQVLTYTVRRDGTQMDVTGPWPSAPVARALQPGSAAYEAGVRPGDVVTAVDGAPIHTFDALVDRVTAAEGAPITLTLWQDGATRDLTMSPRRVDLPDPEGGFETRWLIGISGGLVFDLATETPGLWQTVTQSAGQVWSLIVSSLSGLWHMVSGAISSCNLSGPIGIAQASGAMASQGGQSFVWFVAVLSTAVGLLNLFPIPVLDGGHLVFHAYEAVARKPPSEGALRVLMAVGLSMILTLMLFAIANDLFLCP